MSSNSDVLQRIIKSLLQCVTWLDGVLPSDLDHTDAGSLFVRLLLTAGGRAGAGQLCTDLLVLQGRCEDSPAHKHSVNLSLSRLSLSLYLSRHQVRDSHGDKVIAGL